MTNQEINKIIAEYCGWKHEFNGDDEDPEWYWIPPNNPDGNQSPPDYCNDLNEMNEAEKFLEGGHNWNKYTDILGKLRHYKPNIHDLRSFANIIVSASAKQRAEAFLKTIGKWEE